MPRKKLTRFEEECLERQARGRAGWGLYAAYVQERDMKTRCQNLRSKLESEHCSPREIDEEIEKLVRNETSNILYIG